MKNLKYQIIIWSLFMLNIQNSIAQRNVVWVHGLGDNASAWQHYNQIFDNERAEFTNASSLRTSYYTGAGINYAAYQVINSVNYNSYYSSTGTTHDSRNIGIGHSMGGLMIRDVDRLNGNGNKNFGGYVTVATPNYGAPIANSLLDGSVANAATDACQKITAGPVAELLPLPLAIAGNLYTNDLCDSFVDNQLISSLQGAPTSISDLRVGSPTINAINNYTDNVNPNVPRISIWAEENSPVHWRLLSSDLYGNDQQFVDLVASARGVYQTKYIIHLTTSIACGVGGFWNPACWVMSANHGYKAAQWKKGRNWIDDSENIWSALIKTTRREQHQFWEEVFIPDPDYDECITYLDEEYPWPYDCGTFEYQWVTHWVSVNYPSDGFLPQYTQELQGIPLDNRYKVEGANHLEVLDMSASSQGDVTKQRLDEIFNRPDWFHTN